MPDVPDLSKCTAACQRRFAKLPDGDVGHCRWHEARDSFAARELNFPFRRWYEQASIDDVECWHDEMQSNWKRIRSVQRILSWPFGGRLLGYLSAIIVRSVQNGQRIRDERRVTSLRK